MPNIKCFQYSLSFPYNIYHNYNFIIIVLLFPSLEGKFYEAGKESDLSFAVRCWHHKQ